MKTNKLAAGALALALGLGAVAPVVKADTNYNGKEILLGEYNEKLREVNGLREKAKKAQEQNKAAEDRVERAKKRFEAAEKAYKKLFDEKQKNTYNRLAESLKDLNEKTGLDLTGKDALKNRVEVDVDDIMDRKDLKTEEKKEAVQKAIQDNLSNDPAVKGKLQGLAAAAKVANNYTEILFRVGKVDEDELRITLEYNAALAERDSALSNLKEVKVNNAETIKKYEEALAELRTAAIAYGYVVQVGNDGLKIVSKDDKKVEAAQTRSEKLAKLKAVKADAEETLRAAKLLVDLAPATIKPVEAKLNDLIKKQEGLIEKANKELDKKVSLVATAYASESTDADIDALINDLEENTKEIKDTIENNEKKVVEENKKEEKKEEEKKEEKKAEKKADAPAKKAGSNARTGIAGVAGVAGILAAASVAYAASKRD